MTNLCKYVALLSFVGFGCGGELDELIQRAPGDEVSAEEVTLYEGQEGGSGSPGEVAEEPEVLNTESEGAAEEVELGQLSQALTIAPVQKCYGGNIVREDFTFFAGRACTAHHKRSALSATWDGKGGCSATWVDANNASDCTAIVHANTGGGWGGGCCTVTITEAPAPNEQSCRGRCGQASVDNTCFCDSVCKSFGDCCTDVDAVCR